MPDAWGLEPGDSRFLMIKDAAPKPDQRPIQLVVVQNFFEELKRLVPVR